MSVDLTTKHRRGILDRDYPHIPLNVEDAQNVDIGQVIVIKPDFVWVTVLGAGKDKRKGYYLRYSVRDDRPRLLRSSPHNIDFGDMRRGLDEYGTPRAVSEQDADEAAESSGYTDSAHQALEDAGEAVPVEYQNLLTVQAKSERAEREQADRAEDIARRQARAVTESVRQILIMGARHGVDVSPRIAAIQREVDLANRDLEDAA